MSLRSFMFYSQFAVCLLCVFGIMSLGTTAETTRNQAFAVAIGALASCIVATIVPSSFRRGLPIAARALPSRRRRRRTIPSRRTALPTKVIALPKSRDDGR